MKIGMRACLIVGWVAAAAPVLAQGTPPEDDSTPKLLQIIREQVKPGKGSAHEAVETAWAGAYARAKMTNGWLGMTSMTGPSEAWFLTGLGSWEQLEKNIKAEAANEGLSAEVQKLSAADGDVLSGVNSVITRFVGDMSYQPRVNLGAMRYLQVQIFRLKQGHGRDFANAWKEIVAAHEKAKMDEHWAFFAVNSGMTSPTYLYMQAFKSLADIDQAGPMHEADAYRNAVGEDGRARQTEMTQGAVESTQNLLFAFNPKMSYVPKSWVDSDPAFWAPKPPAPAKKK
jgi:hypothetical protein